MRKRSPRRNSGILTGLVVAVLLGVTGWWVIHHPTSRKVTSIIAPSPAASVNTLSATSARPPWVYGRTDARGGRVRRSGMSLLSGLLLGTQSLD